MHRITDEKPLDMTYYEVSCRMVLQDSGAKRGWSTLRWFCCYHRATSLNADPFAICASIATRPPSNLHHRRDQEGLQAAGAFSPRSCRGSCCLRHRVAVADS